MAADSGSSIQKFIVKSNINNRYGGNTIGKQSSIKKQKTVPPPPFRKHKVPKNLWFAPKSNVFNHKTIQTPLPTPVSIKTGTTVQPSDTTKKLNRIQSSCIPNSGKTTMKAI